MDGFAAIAQVHGYSLKKTAIALPAAWGVSPLRVEMTGGFSAARRNDVGVRLRWGFSLWSK
jgi:hypothetical protein